MNKAEKRQHVLVVDDQPAVLKFMKIDMTLRGFEVAVTTSGEEALGLVRSDKPDIMLLDIVMPGIDGFEVLRRLRSFSELPVIAFSASVSNCEEAIRLGANDFVSKPFHSDEMVGKIRALLNQ